jgi:hypothetical protein
VTRLVYAKEILLALEVSSFTNGDIDPDYLGKVASDLGRVPKASKRKVSPLTFP